MSDLTILLPTKNEVESIGTVIEEIKSTFSLSPKILVVDGKSTDGTLDIAYDKKVDVFVGQGNGKGLDIRGTLAFIDTPYIIMIDSDYTYTAEDAQVLYYLLEVVPYDVVIGCRQYKEKGSMSLTNTFGNFCLSLLASILYKHRVWDVCSGMWGFRKEALDKFNLTSEGFTLEADLFINAVKNKCKIGQIPIRYRKRLEDSRAKLKIWDGFKIGWFLIKRRFAWEYLSRVRILKYRK